MTELSGAEVGIYHAAFLELFSEECRQNCIVAKIVTPKVTKSFIESDLRFDQYVEHYAHRFGRCALGPNVEGMCGKKSICNNELLAGIDNPLESAEILVDV